MINAILMTHYHAYAQHLHVVVVFKTTAVVVLRQYIVFATGKVVFTIIPRVCTCSINTVYKLYSILQSQVSI